MLVIISLKDIKGRKMYLDIKVKDKEEVRFISCKGI